MLTMVGAQGYHVFWKVRLEIADKTQTIQQNGSLARERTSPQRLARQRWRRRRKGESQLE